MSNDNALATLLYEASRVFCDHDSPIAEIASASLQSAAQQPIVKPPHFVAQCEGLHQAYQQAMSPLNTLVEELEEHIHWTDTGSGLKPKHVQERLAYAELIGPTGMVINDHCRIGLFFQSQNTDYPAHRHAAEELYLVISGEATWTKETDPTAKLKSPGEFMHHGSWEPHAMYTTTQPLLAMWCWAGDIGFDQYEMM